MRKGTKKWALVQAAEIVIKQYENSGMKLTLRQIYYRLVAAEIIMNLQSAYQSLGRALTHARKERIINPDMFEDRTRTSVMITDNVYSENIWWKEWVGDLEDNVNNYKIDRWAHQNYKIFVVLEKQALQSVFHIICDDLGITLIVNRGYNSYTQIYEIGKQIHEKAMEEYTKTNDEDKEMIFLTFGDHDPSGRDIMRNFEKQLRDEGIKGRFIECALTPTQIKKYNLPPAPTKKGDARTKKFIEEFGDAMVELDALEPHTLQQMIAENVEKFFDEKFYKERILPIEDEHQKYLKMMFEGSDIKNYNPWVTKEDDKS